MAGANTYGGKDDWDDYDNRNTMRSSKKMAGDVVGFPAWNVKPQPFPAWKVKPSETPSAKG